MATVKVRIAVAVDKDGKWNSCGASGMEDDDMLGLAADCVETGERRYWITAELEMPSVDTVAASQSDAASGEEKNDNR